MLCQMSSLWSEVLDRISRTWTQVQLENTVALMPVVLAVQIKEARLTACFCVKVDVAAGSTEVPTKCRM